MDLIWSRGCRREFKFGLGFFGFSAACVGRAEQIAGSRRLENRFEAIAREQSSPGTSEPRCCAPSVQASLQCPSFARAITRCKLNFNPDLTNVGATFLAREEAVVKQIVARSKSPASARFRINSKIRSGGAASSCGYFSRGFHALARGPVQQAERLIHSQVNCDVRGIASQPIAKRCRAFVGIILHMKDGQPRARAQDRKLRSEACGPPPIHPRPNLSSHERNKMSPEDSERSHPRDSPIKPRAAP